MRINACLTHVRHPTAKRAFRCGVALLKQGNPADALTYFEIALGRVSSNNRTADVLYNIAVCYVRLSQLEAATETLLTAIDADRSVAKYIKSDEDFRPLLFTECFASRLPAAAQREPADLGPHPPESEVSKAFWKDVVPAFITMLACLIAPIFGFSQPVAAIVALYLTLVISSSVYSRIKTGRFELLVLMFTWGKLMVQIVCFFIGLVIVIAIIAGLTGQQ